MSQDLAHLYGECSRVDGRKWKWVVCKGWRHDDSDSGPAGLGTVLMMKVRVRSLVVAAIAGMVLGAVPVAMAAVARSADRGKPVSALLVRKETKGHGRGKRVEGSIRPGLRVLIVDDVATTAGSTLQTVDAVLAEVPEAEIAAVVAVVDRNEGGREACAERGYQLRSLVTVDELFALGENPVE